VLVPTRHSIQLTGDGAEEKKNTKEGMDVMDDLVEQLAKLEGRSDKA